MVKEKFKLKISDEKIIIIDNETKKSLDMTDKYNVQQLVNLLNDWYLIIHDKWF